MDREQPIRVTNWEIAAPILSQTPRPITLKIPPGSIRENLRVFTVFRGNSCEAVAM